MTAPVKRILDELRRRGVEYRVNGDRFEFRPTSAVPPDLIEKLRQNKAALLAALRASPSGNSRGSGNGGDDPLVGPEQEVSGPSPADQMLAEEVRAAMAMLGGTPTAISSGEHRLSPGGAPPTAQVPADLWYCAAVALIERQPDHDRRTELREQFEHRAAIAEYDGGLSRPEAERMAFRVLRQSLGLVE